MIDSHCHLDFPEFVHDREQVWQTALSKGLSGLLIPGTEARHFVRVQQASRERDNCWYGLGLHPWFLSDNVEPDVQLLQNTLQRDCADIRLVALGEIGLDFAIKTEPAIQLRVFEKQLELAQQFHLPVIVHHRKSHNDLIRILKRYPDLQGVIHAFSGSEFEAETYAQMGFKLGVGGTITYQRAQKTKQAIKAVGLSHLLLETDAPAMPLHGYQGQRNTPELLPLVAETLTGLVQESVSEVEKQTTENFKQLFLSG